MHKRIGIAVAVILLFTGCGAQPTQTVRTDFALDTVVRVTVYDATAADAQTALDACFSELARLENLLSATKEGSDVDRINRSAGQTVTVAEETAQVLRLGQHIAALSDGAFDMTVRPLSTLWDFTAEQPTVPSEQTITQALAQVGYRQLSVEGQQVTLTGGAIDLGGVAKGYIADRLREVLLQHDIGSALIDLGGNIVALGDKGGKAFRIGIKDPADTTALAEVVEVRDRSVVTSGTYERGFTVDGVRYHHLLDPKTGYPVQNGLASVTVITESSATADALSTACFVLGEQKARDLIAQFPDTEVLFIYENGTVC